MFLLSSQLAHEPAGEKERHVVSIINKVGRQNQYVDLGTAYPIATGDWLDASHHDDHFVVPARWPR